MARRARRTPDDEVDEGPLEEDLERFGGVTRPCPKCGAELYDDVAVCWKCGHILGTQEDEKGRPWVIITAIVVVGVLLLVGLRFI
jgi:uncharacterized protein (DUF983 family)